MMERRERKRRERKGTKEERRSNTVKDTACHGLNMV
jgi:hypothetical protein